MGEISFDVHQARMDLAIALARQAGEQGEIPVGAAIFGIDGQILGMGENRKERDRDPTAHAEILAIRAAARTCQNWYLSGSSLYVTLEPCPMCAGAIVQARIGTLVYGADDPKTGAIRTVINIPDSAASFHHLQAIAGIRELECQELLQSWFRQHRQKL
ncbi:nucleoside deaminase [Pseudanabaena sp. PCC 6802]|uniref:nucleoside deaminase n=1 Tax=Pseudanabaena sp. PCC 6802 TaxID=118173 RepID=UPI000345B0A6|nr:nucleoside deaminase [Pseudanabaena sp. PCC 6802]